MSEPFGQDRYYSKPTLPDYPDAYSDEAAEAYGFFRHVLGSGERKEEVENAVERWRSKTREKVRVEIKFKFSYDGAQESVPVSVEDGVPPPFVELYRNHPDPLVWQLLLKRSKLETTAKGLGLVENSIGRIEKRFENLAQSDVGKSELASSRTLVEALLKELRGSSVLKSFRSMRSDALGAYFFKTPAIEIYWLPIAVSAEALDVSLEALTVVTLLHERAHAYTHRGFDTDGVQWPTQDFASADLSVVEGLAQYYTWAVCSEMKDEYPTYIRAFNRLLKFQPDPYKKHLAWHPKSESAGEIIRGALISARGRPIFEESSFDSAVGRVRHEQLGEKKKLRFDYWKDLFRRIEDQDGQVQIHTPTPMPHDSASFTMAPSRCELTAHVNTRDQKVAVQLELKDTEEADLLLRLLKEDQSEIREKIGADLIWKPDRKASVVQHEWEADPKDRESWPDQHRRISDLLNRFYLAFAPRLKKMNVAGFETENFERGDFRVKAEAAVGPKAD